MNRELALVNLWIQVALIVGAAAGLYVAKKRRLKPHCLLMRVLVGVQILAIAVVMAPSLSGYLGNWGGWSWFMAETVIHHILGVIVVGLWIYFNLALTGVVKAPRRLRPYMRTAFVAWVVSLALGVHLWIYIWR